MTLLELVLAALATYRIARLITADTILDRPRDAFLRWAQGGPDGLGREHPKWAEFVVCPWCVSMWAGAAAVALAYHLDGGTPVPESAWFVAPTAVLACSAVAGLLSSWEG